MTPSDDHHSQGDSLNPNLLLLLRVLKGTNDIESLLAFGLTYSQIGRLLVEAQESGYVAESSGSIKVTEAAIQLVQLSEDGVRRRDGGWINPETPSRIDLISPGDVFLPHPRKLRLRVWRAR